jgi:AcrR family transcriptional regulator
MTTTSRKRSYDSPRRRAMAADTRVVVLEAAARLFAERGWSGTSVRDVAREAGVSVETVYASVGSKTKLLTRAIEVGVVGDDEPIPLAERPEFAALGQGDRVARLEATTRMLVTQYARVAALERTLDQAAGSEPELAEEQRQTQARLHTSWHDGLQLVLGQEPDAALVDGIRAIGSPQVYLQLVELTGWSPEQYRQWLAQTLFRQLAHIPEETA